MKRNGTWITTVALPLELMERLKRIAAQRMLEDPLNAKGAITKLVTEAVREFVDRNEESK